MFLLTDLSLFAKQLFISQTVTTLYILQPVSGLYIRRTNISLNIYKYLFLSKVFYLFSCVLGDWCTALCPLQPPPDKAHNLYRTYSDLDLE